MSLLTIISALSGSHTTTGGGGGGGTPTQLAAPYSYDVVSGGQTQTNHSWSAITNASNYQLQYWNGSAWSDVASPSGTSYNHTSLTANTMYYYRFRAVGDGVNYTNSDWVYRNELTDDTSTALAQVTETYLTTVGATTPQKTAVRTFITSAISHGYDEDLLALYIFPVGSSLSNKLYNLLDPEDLDAAYRMANISSLTVDDVKGIKLTSASNNNLDTKIYPDDLVDAPKIGVAYYLQTAAQHLIRNDDATMFIIHFSNSDNKAYPNIGGSSAGTPFSGSNAAGLVNVVRTDMDTVKVRLNGVEKASDTRHIDVISNPDTSATYFPNQSIKFYPSAANLVVSFFCVHRITDATKLGQFDTDIIQLMTDLGVNV